MRFEKGDQCAAFERKALGCLDRDGVCGSNGSFLEQSQLAKQVPWQQHREYDLRTPWARAGDLDLSLQDQVEVQARVTLAEDLGAGGEGAAVKLGHKRLQA